MPPVPEHLDVLVVGAGLSGVAAGHYLQAECPWVRYAILEARDAIGGTWDLFRYPGIRSDSDMYTLGYSFRPWDSDTAIADGPAILRYIRETAEAEAVYRAFLQVSPGHVGAMIGLAQAAGGEEADRLYAELVGREG
ncbi:MAG: NAD(P)-binding protein, partial [Acidimicrobiia bacterium]